MTELAEFLSQAEQWLEAHAPRRKPTTELQWGEGPDSVALFRNLSFEEERAHIDETRAWQQAKSDAGYGSISWPEEYGGAGLPLSHENAFRRLESGFQTPSTHEAVGITLDLVAPTVLAWGDDAQRARYVRPMRRTDEMWCQLFSEPGAGSDLASLSTRARRDGDEWVLDGQKVWTSGAQYADFGYILCRTDPTSERHAGITAFIVPMDAPGIEVRPLRQMTGGSSFNEVFLTDVRIPDANRLGPVGDGWKVAITTLGFERASVTKGGGGSVGTFMRVSALSRHLGRNDDPVVRQQLAGLYIDGRLRALTAQRAGARLKAGGVPGPEGSIGKLQWTEGMRRTSDCVSTILGPRLVADSGEWGTYAWSEFVLGAAGYRIAGGSDEIQKNIIAERVLGLPR